MNTPSAPALINSERRAERRFAPEAEPLTGFGAFPLPTDAGARMRQLWPPLFTPEEEAAIEAQYAQEEVIDQEEARSIAELAEDHLEQRLEMEADDDRAGDGSNE